MGLITWSGVQLYVLATDKKAQEMETFSRPEAGDAATASQDISEIKVDTATSNLVQCMSILPEVFAFLFTTNKPQLNEQLHAP